MTDTFLPEITVEHPGLYEDEWFDLRGNGDSYLLARWFPADEQGTPTQPKAVIVFVHGFAELWLRGALPAELGDDPEAAAEPVLSLLFEKPARTAGT